MRRFWPATLLIAASACHDREHDPVPADVDGDGLLNDVDTDDDGDGRPDDVDVDADGDGGLDRPAPEEIPEAVDVAAEAYCQYAQECCQWHLDFNPDRWSDGCEQDLRAALLVEFVQAAVGATAAGDWSMWDEERRTLSFEPLMLRCPDFWVEKGQRPRLEILDMFLLPFVLGTVAEGEPCVTRWDCDRRLRCEGLTEGPLVPGVCAPLPTEGTSCGATEPRCPAGTSCTIFAESTRCERPRPESEPCHVFELDGRTTDNCAADQWCDEGVVDPVCRPVLREGDPCTEARQCLAFDCPAQDRQCPPVAPVYDASYETVQTWCEEVFPSLQPLPR
jgi:hypothetical protein